MSLNIKNPEAHRLAAALAKVKGTSITEAVIEAVRMDLERSLKRTNLARDLRRISERTAPLFKEPWKSMEHGDLLYDELGLPK